jgi:hypothetical protein
MPRRHPITKSLAHRVRTWPLGPECVAGAAAAAGNPEALLDLRALAPRGGERRRTQGGATASHRRMRSCGLSHA